MSEETATVNTILQELRKFRTENNKRWEENDKKLETINERVTKIENKREAGKKEFPRIFQTMQETIMEQFNELNEKIDIKFSKADAMFADLGLDVKELHHTAKKHQNKINLYGVRIEKLENWKDELDVGGLVNA